MAAGLTTPENAGYQFPIHYAYDYLRGSPRYLQRPQLHLNDHLNSAKVLSAPVTEARQGSATTKRSENAIDIFPLRAKLPWHSGIISCRQSKHWQPILDTTRQMLEEIAASDSDNIISKSGQSLADIAQEELTSRFEEGWVKFTAYVCPEANEQRSKILAAIMVFIFVFDGMLHIGKKYHATL
jgi:hypothetical protein